MAPKITITLDDKRYSVEPRDSSSATVQGLDACPACGQKGAVLVAGRDKRIESHDTYAAEGHALCCGKRLGTVRAVVDTLFGLREDAAVLHGRPRVY